MVARSTEQFIIAMAVWAMVAIVATQLVSSQPLLGLAVGVLGGIAVGLISARRLDPRRVRMRRGRRSRSRSTPDA